MHSKNVTSPTHIVDTPTKATAQGTPRRTYAKPELTDHGNVEAITRGAASTTSDYSSGRHK